MYLPKIHSSLSYGIIYTGTKILNESQYTVVCLIKNSKMTLSPDLGPSPFNRCAAKYLGMVHMKIFRLLSYFESETRNFAGHGRKIRSCTLTVNRELHKAQIEMTRVLFFRQSVTECHS